MGNKTCNSHQYSKDTNDKFLDFIDDCYLEQSVIFPTRVSNTHDLLLVKWPSLLKRCKSTPGFEDHNSTILSHMQCHPQLPKSIQQKIYTWNKPEKGQLRADVATQMGMFILKNTVQTPINDLWWEFNSTIKLLQTKYVPSKLTSKRFTHTWFTKAYKSKVKKRRSCI